MRASQTSSPTLLSDPRHLACVAHITPGAFSAQASARDQPALPSRASVCLRVRKCSPPVEP
eukprot:4725393-Alexandrium_andersonii.AAC.1